MSWGSFYISLERFATHEFYINFILYNQTAVQKIYTKRKLFQWIFNELYQALEQFSFLYINLVVRIYPATVALKFILLFYSR